MYRDQVYPQGIPAQQNIECHQAFMAGALEALHAVERSSNCANTDEAEREAAAGVARWFREAEDYARARVTQLQGRN